MQNKSDSQTVADFPQVQTRAACLTPPAAGGVAVIQVIGPDAPGLLQPHLQSRGPLNTADLASSQIRLCRLVDEQEVIDDVLVAHRRSSTGEPVIDLNLHGGIRIVQRVLLLLKQAGARIVDAKELLAASWPADNAIEFEAWQALLQAKTRHAARWLARLAEALPATVMEITSLIERGDCINAITRLQHLITSSEQSRYLLAGVRVVLAGAPNSGKSTLANLLAGREQAIVSELPGTTRDWIEHHGAIAGVPFTFVDTAGIRRTKDPLEKEAIRRARAQLTTADVVLRMIDASTPPRRGEIERSSAREVHGRHHLHRTLTVWTKSDLPMHPNREQGIEPTSDIISISAVTNRGIDRLTEKLLERVHLPLTGEWPITLFTARQQTHAENALALLKHEPIERQQAVRELHFLLNKI